MSYSKQDLMRVLIDGEPRDNISHSYNFKANDAIPDHICGDPALERIFVHAAVLPNGTPLVASGIYTGDLEDPAARQAAWKALEYDIERKIVGLQFYEKNAQAGVQHLKTQEEADARQRFQDEINEMRRQRGEPPQQIVPSTNELLAQARNKNAEAQARLQQAEEEDERSPNFLQTSEVMVEVSAAIEDDDKRQEFEDKVDKVVEKALEGVSDQVVRMGIDYGVSAGMTAQGQWLPHVMFSDKELRYRAIAAVDPGEAREAQAVLDKREKKGAEINAMMKDIIAKKSTQPAESKTKKEKPINA